MVELLITTNKCSPVQYFPDGTTLSWMVYSEEIITLIITSNLRTLFVFVNWIWIPKFETAKLFCTDTLTTKITRQMAPIPRLASSFLVVVFIHVNRKEEEEGETEQQQQFTKGCNILHRLQVYHLTLTFIIHNKYTSTLYLYTYMHIMIALIMMPFIDRINVRYKLLGTYIWEKWTRIHDYFFQLWVPMLLEHQVWMISYCQIKTEYVIER